MSVRPRRSRSAGPDQLKALLLVLVIFGHTFAERLDDSFTKWLIYGFHMPAFLFLSGYLLRAERLQERSYPELLTDYGRRMLLPWLAVSLLWASTFGVFPTDLRAVAELFTAPQWHLWYVPVLFAMISLTWLAVRLPHPFLLLAGTAAVGWLIWGTPLAEQLPPQLDLVDDRYFSYLVWFVAGFSARNTAALRPHPALLIPGLLAAAVYSYSYQGSDWLAAISFLVLNLCLVTIVPAALDELREPRAGWLVFMGQQSLWVYLFHAFATEPLRDADLPTLVQRTAGLALTALICAVVALWYFRSESKARSAERV
ncbi:acyltransferase [Kineosporia rhizophila]|uniref:acyltransferase family protein n=1 Tax=Kineosporia TaxID=49184 RepID=UPI001E480598|nr:acyltransferase [Kineosporia sp. NBRC 101677]MCE0534626.1 acyltransferase [Kineosporia rhizophila]GLY15583.1 membrane protein [Kineosporia sp. NBRC 101677]